MPTGGVVWKESHDLVQALCCAETSWPSANDKDINITVQRKVSHIGDPD